MNTLILAVALAALMPIVFAGLAKRQGGYDNRALRAGSRSLRGPKLVPRLPRKTAMRPFHPLPPR